VEIGSNFGPFYHREVGINEHSGQARAPHTNEPRTVPRCGALSLLQKPIHYMGDSGELALNPYVVDFGPDLAIAYGS
jgi:hypothetical protein